MAFISALTGLYKDFIIMYFIIIIHELGHITFAILYKYKISKINIYPFGGYTQIEGNINNNILGDLLISLGGVIFQIIPMIIVKSMNINIYKSFITYNNTILIFNLIPIIPLDGSKVINTILNIVLPFKLSHKLTIYISYILLLLGLIIVYKDINKILMIILLLILTTKELKNHIYIFNTFILERLLKKYKYKFNNFIIGKNINKMRKYKRNIFIYNNKYIDELELLKERYNK